MATPDDDFAKVAADIKKRTEDFKRKEADKLLKSKDANLRDVGENWKRSLQNDTATMLETGSGRGKRINAEGRAAGPELKKLAPGEYEAPVKKAKGGRVRTASQRADGIALRGKTRA